MTRLHGARAPARGLSARSIDHSSRSVLWSRACGLLARWLPSCVRVWWLWLASVFLVVLRCVLLWRAVSRGSWCVWCRVVLK